MIKSTQNKTPFQSYEEWLSHLKALMVVTGKVYTGLTDEETLINDSEIDRLRVEYWQRLPVEAVSVCPFCNDPFWCKFDPFGFEGDFWDFPLPWQPLKGQVPKACKHYVDTIGTIDFKYLDVVMNPEFTTGSGELAMIRSKIYVTPYLLEPKQRLGVVTRLTMRVGYDVHLISHFDERAPSRKRLGYEFLQSAGYLTRNYKASVYDYDLKPYLEKKKLLWCDPGDNEKLSARPVSEFPFYDKWPEREGRLLIRPSIGCGAFIYNEEKDLYDYYKIDEYEKLRGHRGL